MTTARRIKCVVWDLDETLVEGVALEREAGSPLRLDSRMVALIERFHRRGIVNSVASRNPPEVLEEVVAAAPVLRDRFVAPQLSWGRKSDAIRKVAATLDVGLDAIAFVDDDPFERSEVQGSLPDVLVLARGQIEAAAAMDAFTVAAVTPEGRRRTESYRANEARRSAAAAFATYEEFLRSCAITIRVSAATADDAERLAELAARTQQYNSSGEKPTAGEFVAATRCAGTYVAAVRVRDRFGDDGLVGAFVRRLSDDGTAELPLVMASCRAALRGVVRVLLTHALDESRRVGAAVVRLPVRPNARNVPLRLTLADYGFVAVSEVLPIVLFERDLTVPHPGLPQWASVELA